jgi:hypothetical protein
MDSRSIFIGLLLIGAGCGGSILVSSAHSLQISGLIGLLLLVIPAYLTLWYLVIRMRELEEMIRNSGRQVRRAVEDHSFKMSRRYDETIREVTDLNAELNKRVYR